MDERVEVTGSKLLLGVYNLASFKAMINLPGDKFRLLIALYTGNYRLKKHLSNILEHLILDCTAICRHRLKALVSICVDSNHIRRAQYTLGRGASLILNSCHCAMLLRDCYCCFSGIKISLQFRARSDNFTHRGSKHLVISIWFKNFSKFRKNTLYCIWTTIYFGCLVDY